MERSEKARENRLRRMAERQGLQLMRSRRRDPRAIGYGDYMLVDGSTNSVAFGSDPHPYSLSLDDVEEYLSGTKAPTA